MAKASSRRDGAPRRARSAPLPAAGAPDASAIVDAARDVGVELDADRAAALAHYGALLVRWNRVHNLTARESADDVLRLHLADSLAILPALRALLGARLDDARARVRMLDVGAGGGLPGIPCAIAEPRLDVTLLDKVAKKVAFLTQAKLELRLDNVACVHARVEDFRPPAPFAVIVARAFASLAEFTALTRHLLETGGIWAAMKGAVPDAEVAALPPTVAVRDIVKLRVPRLDAERHLVVLEPRPAP